METVRIRRVWYRVENATPHVGGTAVSLRRLDIKGRPTPDTRPALRAPDGSFYRLGPWR